MLSIEAQGLWVICKHNSIHKGTVVMKLGKGDQYMVQTNAMMEVLRGFSPDPQTRVTSATVTALTSCYPSQTYSFCARPPSKQVLKEIIVFCFTIFIWHYTFFHRLKIDLFGQYIVNSFNTVNSEIKNNVNFSNTCYIISRQTH